MDRRTLDLIDSLPSALGDERWWETCLGGLRSLGVESVCYVARPFAGGTVEHGLTASSFIRSTHPDEWARAVLDTGGLDQDVTAVRAFGGTDVVPWHDESLWDDASAEQRRINDLENELGLRVGVTLSLGRGAFGTTSGIGLCTPHVRAESFDAYRKEHAVGMQALAALLEGGLAGERSKLMVKLSPRERDVMTLLAAGFRPDEIARRLHRSPKTINNVVEQAKRRLKACTRDHAVAKAVWLGLVTP